MVLAHQSQQRRQQPGGGLIEADLSRFVADFDGSAATCQRQGMDGAINGPASLAACQQVECRFLQRPFGRRLGHRGIA